MEIQLPYRLGRVSKLVFRDSASRVRMLRYEMMAKPRFLLAMLRLQLVHGSLHFKIRKATDKYLRIAGL